MDTLRNRNRSKVTTFKALKTHRPLTIWESSQMPLYPLYSCKHRPFQLALVVKNLPASAGDIRDTGSIPGWGRSPGGGHGHPLQYSCLETTMDRRAWRIMVHRVTKVWTWLKWVTCTQKYKQRRKHFCLLLSSIRMKVATWCSPDQQWALKKKQLKIIGWSTLCVGPAALLDGCLSQEGF